MSASRVTSFLFAAVSLASQSSTCVAFVPPMTRSPLTSSITSNSPATPSPALHMSDFDTSGSFDSQIEEIEFKIYPDGRIEETVRGVKGENCHEVTEAINSMLGKTTASKPTEEMYEQEIEISNTVQERMGTDSGSGDSSSSAGWEGSSSW